MILPSPKIIALGAILAALAVAGVQTVRLHRAQAQLATERADWQREARIATEALTTDYTAKITQAAQVAEEQRAKNSTLAASLAGSQRAGRGLRDELARLRTTGRADHDQGAPTPNGGNPTGTAPGVPADGVPGGVEDVARRIDERLDAAADAIAQFADTAHGAALTCGRVYNVFRR